MVFMNLKNLFLHKVKPLIPAGKAGEAPGGAPTMPQGLVRHKLLPIFIEMLLPLGFITLLSYIFDGGNRFISMSPHPFWIVLLPIVVHHGTQKGLMCAVFCSLFLLMGNIPEQLAREDLYDYFFKVMGKPLLWFVTAFVLGELRVRHMQEITDWKIKASEAISQKLTLEKAFQNLKKIKEALEVRIAAEFRTPAAPLRTVGDLIQPTPGLVVDHFIKAVQELINPDKFSVYVLEGNQLNLTYQNGWTREDTYQKSFEVNSLLYQGIVNHKRDLCIIDKTDETNLEGQGVLAIPMIDRRTGAVFAMVKFEKISFRELNLSNIEAIRELCQCTCRAYMLSLEILELKNRLQPQPVAHKAS